MSDDFVTYGLDEPFPGTMGRTIDDSTETWPMPIQAPGGSAIGVTEVAVDLGFNHLGRFARHCAATFDEPPSATLRRPHAVLDEGP